MDAVGTLKLLKYARIIKGFAEEMKIPYAKGFIFPFPYISIIAGWRSRFTLPKRFVSDRRTQVGNLRETMNNLFNK